MFRGRGVGDVLRAEREIDADEPRRRPPGGARLGVTLSGRRGLPVRHRVEDEPASCEALHAPLASTPCACIRFRAAVEPVDTGYGVDRHSRWALRPQPPDERSRSSCGGSRRWAASPDFLFGAPGGAESADAPPGAIGYRRRRIQRQREGDLPRAGLALRRLGAHDGLGARAVLGSGGGYAIYMPAAEPERVRAISPTGLRSPAGAEATLRPGLRPAPQPVHPSGRFCWRGGRSPLTQLPPDPQRPALVPHSWYKDGMARVRISTTVDQQLLATARQTRSGANDSTLIDEALRALLARSRPVEIDAAYAASTVFRSR